MSKFAGICRSTMNRKLINFLNWSGVVDTGRQCSNYTTEHILCFQNGAVENVKESLLSGLNDTYIINLLFGY